MATADFLLDWLPIIVFFAIALALAGGAGYWLYANATPLVLALAPWAVVGAAAARRGVL